jgi:hypothetical protein
MPLKFWMETPETITNCSFRINGFTSHHTKIQGAYKLSEDFVTFVLITHSERNIWWRRMFTFHHFQRHYQNCESASTPQSCTSHKTSLWGFGGNWSIAWTSAVSHVGRTSKAFKVTIKATIPLSNGSNLMYFCPVFVQISFCKILR